MNTHTHPSTRFVLLALLALCPAASWAPAPAAAQQIPWIGLAAPGAQLHGEIGQYPHSPTGADHFGFAVAAGDFNGDGFDDLASGIPGNDCDVVTWDCGSVQVRFGWSEGPLGAALTLDPAHPGAPEPAEAFDEYGRALATGDFNGDGDDDLAVGVPGDDDVVGPGGAVRIHYGVHGSPGGIQGAAGHSLEQGQNGVPLDAWSGTAPSTEESFGHALAVGDFDGDGFDDLAIAAPWAISPERERAGNVIVAHGWAGGLMPFGGFLMRLDLDALPDMPEEDDEFGYALAAGDFNLDGFDDLAIGVPGEDDVGKVLVVYGSEVSLIFPSHRYFGSLELGGESQPGMRFGHTLAAGDFDGDGRDDLAIGAPTFDGQGQPQPVDMGIVAVVYGPPLDPLRVHWLYEHALYGPGPYAGARFGSALSAGDFDGNGIDDLAIGTPAGALPVPFLGSVGVVSVVPGRPVEGLTGAARKLRPVGALTTLDFVDPAGLIPDYRQGFPAYGASLAAGDFDGSGIADLAIGAPSRDVFTPTTQPDTGAVAVLYGRLFADGFETGGAGAWSSAVP